MSLGHCLMEGGRDGIRERKGVKPGSQYNASSCVVLRSFAIMRGIVNVLWSTHSSGTDESECNRFLANVNSRITPTLSTLVPLHMAHRL